MEAQSNQVLSLKQYISNMDAFENHSHTGIDQPKINPKNLLGFPVYQKETALSHVAPNGTISLRWKTSDNTYYLTAFINGGWREIELT